MSKVRVDVRLKKDDGSELASYFSEQATFSAAKAVIATQIHAAVVAATSTATDLENAEAAFNG